MLTFRRLVSLLSLVFISACTNPPKQESSQVNVGVEKSSLLSSYRSLIHQDLSKTKSFFSVKDEEIKEGLSYGRLRGLSLIEVHGNLPSTLYCKGEKVILVYISGSRTNISVSQLQGAYPQADVINPSRAGKRFSHYVVAKEGVSWSDNGEEVAFIEIFPPTTVSNWKKTFYQDPGLFHK